jgi:orotidine-5'-phosphate decarboxylase
VNHFADRLVDAIRAAGAPTCVGLDPVLEKLPTELASRVPAQAIETFCRAVIDAVAGHVAAIKPQSACFERHGPDGVRALAATCRHAREKGLIVLLDAKRGDIGLTAEHYAAAAKGMAADAITVNAYLGPETVTPYLKAGLGIFILIRTSNPDSDSIQSRRLEDGRTVAEMMADAAAAIGRPSIGVHDYSDVGAVVGATKASDGRALRQRMPHQIFLVPGYGAQGGTPDDLRALHDGRVETGGGMLVTASRSVIYAFQDHPGPWQPAIARAAIKFSTEVRAVVS